MIAIVNSQCEYWKREFGATVIVKKKNFQNVVKKAIDNGLKPVIQIDDDLDELNFLSELPKNSFIGWLYADESLNLSFNKKVSRLESISIILRPYHLNPQKMRNIKSSLTYIAGNLKQIRSGVEFIKAFLWFWRGLGMYSREWKIMQMMKRQNRLFYNFPLGYTDVFCYSYLNTCGSETIDRNQSLLSRILPSKIVQTKSLSFVGQVGQIVRMLAIRCAEIAPNSIVIRRDVYGAGNYETKDVRVNGLEYVRILLSSKFVLCPPGNISGNTFRIHETVIARRVPLVISNPLSDPNFESPVASLFPGEKITSWNKLITEIESVTPEKYQELVNTNFWVLNNQIKNARKFIENFEKT